MLSAALLLRHSLDLPKEAQVLEAAVAKAVSDGVLPADVSAGKTAASTAAAGDAVIARI